MAHRDFRKMRAWRLGMRLLEQILPLADGFPPAETYALAQLLRNAAMGFPSSLARACGSLTRRSFLANIVAAEGTLLEIDTWLEVAQRSGYISKDRATLLLSEVQTIRRELEHLQDRVKSRRHGGD